jgi:hypothetical protein
MHHHAFNWINQPDAATSKVYNLLFKYSSTCFGHPHAYLQELQQLQYQPQVYCQSLVIAVLLVMVGPASQPDHDQQHCYHQAPTVNLRLLLQLL